MSFGKMNCNIEIISTEAIKDSEGFVSSSDVVVAHVRGYFEQKNATEKWTNMAQNSSVNALFRFRAIPNFTLKNEHFIRCNGKRYNIFSIENVRNRNMYFEVLAQGAPVAVSVDGES